MAYKKRRSYKGKSSRKKRKKKLSKKYFTSRGGIRI